MHLRSATPEDAERLVEIYAPYVEKTAISFEYRAPTADQFRQRMVQTLRSYPFVVAVDEGRIVGYAYAGRFHDREAYDWSVETSIYVEAGNRGKGIGRRLHQELESRLRAQGIENMNACIAHTQDPDDPYLTADSERFHQRMGYRRVAHFHQCGKKFNRWYDMVWMEKLIGNHATD